MEQLDKMWVWQDVGGVIPGWVWQFALPLPQLYLVAWSCGLLDPQFVQHVCQFYITQSVWLIRQMEGCREVRREGEREGVL